MNVSKKVYITNYFTHKNMKGDVPLVAKSPPTEPEASLPEPGTMNVLDEIPKDEPLYTEVFHFSNYRLYFFLLHLHFV